MFKGYLDFRDLTPAQQAQVQDMNPHLRDHPGIYLYRVEDGQVVNVYYAPDLVTALEQEIGALTDTD